jgi:hypothetical protein
VAARRRPRSSRVRSTPACPAHRSSPGAVSGDGPLDVGGQQVENLTSQGYDVTITNWRGIVGPPGLSDEQRDQVVDFVERVQASPAWKKNLQRFGWTAFEKSGESPDHITCQEVVELVTDYFEGALPADEAELLEQHLNFCDGCG